MSMVKNIGIVVIGVVLGTGTSAFVLMKATGTFVSRLNAAQKEHKESKQPEKPWDFWTVEMEHLSEDLNAEKAKLKAREEAVDQQMARVQIERQEVENARKQLETMRKAIDSRLLEVSEDEAANIKKLAKKYSTIPARNAVAIYKEMDDETVAKLLSFMKDEVVSQVIDEMSRQSATDPALAKRAARLTDKLRLMKAPKPTSN